MGLFWDLYQQSQLSQHAQRSGEIESRVAMLEAELRRTQVVVLELIRRLEKHFGQDFDEDGRVGQ